MTSARRPVVGESDALVVRAIPYRDSDLVVTLVTRSHGKLSAMVRGARRSSKRFGGALEPMHGVVVRWEDRGGELVTLVDARVARVRSALVQRLAALEAAGRALRWLRHVCPPRTPEPGAFEAACELLDALERGEPETPTLCAFGARLLAEIGWGVEMSACVRCGKPCPPDKPSAFDAVRGGLVCQACGGAPRVISASVRAAFASGEARDEEQRELLALIDDVMQAHAGYEEKLPLSGRPG